MIIPKTARPLPEVSDKENERLAQFKTNMEYYLSIHLTGGCYFYVMLSPNY